VQLHLQAQMVQQRNSACLRSRNNLSQSLHTGQPFAAAGFKSDIQFMSPQLFSPGFLISQQGSFLGLFCLIFALNGFGPQFALS
jgi:hypothetical protein